MTGLFTWDHVLYRFYDRSGELLYVGMTRSIRARFRVHAIEQPWWPEVADCSIEFLPSREALGQAEIAAIEAEHPRYNVRHNSRPKPSPLPLFPSRNELRPDGFTHDEWAWMHNLPPYDQTEKRLPVWR